LRASLDIERKEKAFAGQKYDFRYPLIIVNINFA